MPSLGVDEWERMMWYVPVVLIFTADNGKRPVLRVLRVSCVFLGIKGQ